MSRRGGATRGGRGKRFAGKGAEFSSTRNVNKSSGKGGNTTAGPHSQLGASAVRQPAFNGSNVYGIVSGSNGANAGGNAYGYSKASKNFGSGGAKPGSVSAPKRTGRRGGR